MKAVIFDMYETLITHYNCPIYFGAQMAKDAGIDEERYVSEWRCLEDARTLGKMTFEDVVKKILEDNKCYTDSTYKTIVEKRLATQGECFKHMHEEIILLLDALKKRKILVGLISNCFSEEAKLIRESVLFPYFDEVCLSYEEGVKKPDEEIYHRCMSRLGVKAEECIYVGDGGSNELQTARKLGMKPLQAVWYLKDGTLQASKRMDDFVQVESPMDIFEYID